MSDLFSRPEDAVAMIPREQIQDWHLCPCGRLYHWIKVRAGGHPRSVCYVCRPA